MKTKWLITAVVFIISANIIKAQDEKIKHFEVALSANFWTPSSSHLKASNRVTQVHIDNTYYADGGVSGYGTSIAPILNLTYYFKKNLGVCLGFYPLIMNNEVSVKTTDTSFVNYENEAFIANFTLGLVGQALNTSNINIYYGLGINFVPNYNLEMHMATESSNPRDIEANDLALGLYLKSGVKIKLNHFLSLVTGLEYSFIPTELEYTNNDGLTINEKTNLGGLGLQIGLAVNF